MKPLQTLAIATAAFALLIFAAAEAGAQRRSMPVSGGFAVSSPRHHGGHFRGGHLSNIVWGGREVVYVVEREVVREEPAAAPPAAAEPPPPPRQPFVVGKSYSSLPGGCLKSIEEGGKATFYYCSGEWFRQLSGGRDARYKAVARP